MNFSIVPYSGDSPFKPWPSLAPRAFILKSAASPGSSLFFFDVLPSGLTSVSGAPVIVLIHGLGDEADSWRHIIPLLSRGGFRVLALDLPGFGRSNAPGKINVKNHALAVIKLLEAAEFGAGTPVFLAGNSMGAVVAETAVIKRPELIRGLILVDGCIPGGPSNPGLIALARLLFSRKWYREYRENPGQLWLSLYRYYADLDKLPAEDLDFLKSRVMTRVESAAQERAFFATQTSIILTHVRASSFFTREIRKYKGKILLVWGEKDEIIPLSSADAFIGLRGDIELEVIPGAGHLPQQEKPEETAGHITKFITKYAAGS